MVQVIGSPEGRFFTWFSLPLAPASCLCVPKVSNSRQTLYLGVCPRILYFFSVLWKYGYVTCEIYIKCGVFFCVYTDYGLVSLARLRPVRGRRTRIKYVIDLTGLVEAFRHSWYQSKKLEMADRRDWGGGGDDPEKSTQRMIERIWEILTDIRARMDQQAPVPPVAVPPGDGETVPIALVPPRVEVPFVAPVLPPVLLAEEPVMQVEKFIRLQPPTYSGGPNPDTVEHWVHEIERVFVTMRCPTTDKVVLATYQLRGFALEWWRLKMLTTFAGRTEEVITWSEFHDVFNDTFFPIQVQQVKREQFRTLQQGSRLCVPKVSNRYRRVVGGSWDVWRCRITRGNAVAWCNCRGSLRRVRCEPGNFGGFKRALSCTSGYAPGSCTSFQFCGNMAM
ncbi:hypothetical protein Taro_020487 [Colocasia esculenta]|uniref:Retrotransposon gag domain-containing protein n=1 Tax=Colocasia esculenta TaxID=4460 RepID=A0A843V2H2_COLES|nr:hypothetical protein [Colocasia esculenta]